MRAATPVTPTVVFDLDGTLVHTVPDIAAALDTALKPYEVAPTSDADAATMMGDGLSEFFWRALVDKRLNLPASEAHVARKRFIEIYARAPAKRSQVYPGVRELLHELRGRGVRTAVCTNKIESISLDILEQLELRGHLDAVVGARDDQPMKPDPRPLVEAVARAGGRIERTLLVGDTGADNGAAIAARIPVILLDYGYSHLSVNALTYGIIVDRPEDLRAAVMAFVGPDPMPVADRDVPPHWST